MRPLRARSSAQILSPDIEMKILARKVVKIPAPKTKIKVLRTLMNVSAHLVFGGLINVRRI